MFFGRTDNGNSWKRLLCTFFDIIFTLLADTLFYTNHLADTSFYTDHLADTPFFRVKFD